MQVFVQCCDILVSEVLGYHLLARPKVESAIIPYRTQALQPSYHQFWGLIKQPELYCVLPVLMYVRLVRLGGRDDRGDYDIRELGTTRKLVYRGSFVQPGSVKGLC